MKNIISILAATFFLGFFLPGCMTLENINQKNINERQINGRSVEYIAEGIGSPTIVLETGMGPTINTWAPILDSLTNLSSTFAYNRPGYGNSDLSLPPFSAEEVALQLHENLEATNQRPPYILIGHSAGGLYINMFSRLFPGEVAGVIFIDSSHPDQFEYFRQDQPLIYNMLVTGTKNGNRKYEFSIVKNAHSIFQDAPPFPNVPVSVLTAGKKSSPLEGDKMRARMLEFQSDLAALSPNSKNLIVEGSGHYIHKDKPEVVLDEVVRILSEVSVNNF